MRAKAAGHRNRVNQVGEGYDTGIGKVTPLGEVQRGNRVGGKRVHPAGHAVRVNSSGIDQKRAIQRGVPGMNSPSIGQSFDPFHSGSARQDGSMIFRFSK